MLGFVLYSPMSVRMFFWKATEIKMYRKQIEIIKIVFSIQILLFSIVKFTRIDRF